MQSAANASPSACEINVTPLIDVLLVLLIIFMVIVPVLPHGVASAVPQGASTAPEMRPVIIEVQAGVAEAAPKYVIDGRGVSFDGIVPTLRGFFASHPDVPVFVCGVRSLSFQRVALVVAEARRAGASTVALRQL